MRRLEPRNGPWVRGGLTSALLCLGAVGLAGSAMAQPAATPLPEKHIPPTVLMELRAVENQFDLALVRDCAPERCASKGCVYRDHVVVDLPRSSSLPGLGQSEGVGSVPPQEYLTQAHCEFAVEKSVSPRDVQALQKRLEQRLSKGWLQVTVGRQLLEPISASLAESPPAPVPPAPKPVEPPPAAPVPPPQWEAGVALRELWLSLLPHFSWMIALVLATLATLAIIWALRRLGRESLEEKALAAQLAASAAAKPVDEPAGAAPQVAAPAAVDLAAAEQAAAVAEQRRRWTERVAKAELTEEGDAVVELLREWLKAGELGLLAKAILVFGDRLAVAFPSDGELAERKVELADFLKGLDEARLPSDADFFKTLSQHVVSASLLAQSDADTFRSLRDELGSAGLAQLMGQLPVRHGALLFALVPAELQDEVGRTLPPELRSALAEQLLLTNRMAREERQYLFAALDAARAGREVPVESPAASEGLVDRGRILDVAGALSVLLPLVEPSERQALLSSAVQRTGGAYPRWYEDILYPDMLLKVPGELLADLLLEVDVRGLAGWVSTQEPAWQAHFIGALSPTLQNALKANLAFGSRRDQLRLAQLGRGELVAAVKRLMARGRVSFADVLA